MDKNFELYILLLEKLIDELQNEVSVLKSKVELLEYQNNPLKPQTPWETKWGKLDSCPKCGIRLDQVTSYSCQNVDCPTGLGPVWCKA